ncbi:hypothetical protein ACU4GH_00310 [Bradyrhizobium betae]|jgi:hypothetical protein
MAPSSATASMRTLIVILSLAAMPAVAFAQASGGTGGSAGSTGGVAGSPSSAPGTNSLGTAQSSGAAPGTGMTTGTAGPTDAAVNAENRILDKKLKSICRGC